MNGAPALCPACHAPAEATARFCSRCGTQLEPGNLGEARRTVTALFADVVGSTALAERLDPEDFRSVIGEAVAIMAAAVEAFDGTVEHVAGDGLLGLFGVPRAHEDDAERAVLAALRLAGEISERAAEVAGRWSIEPPAVRAGIETGLVVVGPLARMELAAMGDSVNTAARLQAAARPGSVLVGERTRRLVEGSFEWGERRELRLKGKAEPVLAVEALRPSERRARSPLARLVGRGRELEAGTSALREAARGRGGVLLVVGEAGIGKSRLIWELYESWRSWAPEGSLWLAGRCASYGGTVPYLPFKQLLRDPELLAGAADLEPLLASVLDAEPLRRATGPDPDLRRRMFAAVRTLIERRAEQGPLVLALDDVHWADPSSAALVEHLLPLLASAPVLLVMALRADDRGPARSLPAIARALLGERVRELRLEPLAGDTDRRLLEELLGNEALPAELELRLLERAVGNPFYIEQLAQSLVDTGALASDGERLRYLGGAEERLPDTLERLVLARIDRLPARPREVVRAASVLGRQFSEALLEAIAGSDVPSALLELERHDVVHRFGADGFRFKHTLLQEAVYGSLLKRRRQQLHGRTALALERIDPRSHGLLAHHWSAAGDDERAVTEHARAAAAALAVYALDEAGEHAARGLAAAERAGLETGDGRIARLMRLRGGVRFFGDDTRGAAADLERARAAAHAAGDEHTELWALLDIGRLRHEGLDRSVQRLEGALRLAERLNDHEAVVEALASHAIIDASRLRLAPALERAERARLLAAQRGGERLLGRALDALKLVALLLGDLERLERLASAAAAIHRRQADPFYLSWALMESAFVPLARGRIGAARTLLQEALALNEEAGDRSHRGLFLDALCWLERSRGAYDEAIEIGAEAFELSRRAGLPEFAAWSAATLGWTLLEAGQPGRAAERLVNGLALAEQSEAPAQVLRCAGLLAAAEQERGRHERAAAAARRADDVLSRVTAPAGGGFVFGGHALLALAGVHLAHEDAPGAMRIAAPLLAAAGRSGWVETQAQAALVLASCRESDGDSAVAHSLRQRALALAAAAGLPGVERAALSR